MSTLSVGVESLVRSGSQVLQYPAGLHTSAGWVLDLQANLADGTLAEQGRRRLGADEAQQNQCARKR